MLPTMDAAEVGSSARRAVALLLAYVGDESAGRELREEAVAVTVRTMFAHIAAARGMGPVAVGSTGPWDDGVLEGVRELLVPVRELEIEELGYLYEGLIETGARKQAGAHYTPRALAEEVVQHALEPLMHRADGKAVSSSEILELRVVDIAAGSGVFLIAAAQFLAARLAEAWGREGVPGRDAVREIVRHCLYGADINPTAVEICRRSLWLLAGDPSLPLTFLDDRVLCGNSLVGLVSEREVAERRVGVSTGSPSGGAGASVASASVRVADAVLADAVVATALAYGGKPGRELEAAYGRLETALAAGDLAALGEICSVGLTPTVPTGYSRWRPLHWALVVPEVMARGGFDAVIGNPPFLGVKNIRGALGQNLRDYLAQTLLRGESGRSDLVVFFLARAARLSRRTVGLVLPDGISEGDIARHGPAAALAQGFRIYRAETSRPWPSEAGVRIALLWMERAPTGSPNSVPAVLDGVPVAEIGPGLGRTATGSRAGKRVPPVWIPHGYQATIVLGKSLVLTRAQAAAMVAEDARSADWIREYLSGDDLVSTVGPRSTRQVLDVGALEPQVWGQVPPVARHLREVVLPERERQFAKYPHLTERWWRFHNRVDRLYDEMVGLSETIALAKHAKYIWPVLVPVGPVISNGAIVYPTEDRAVFGFLASEPHRIWAIEEGGSRLNQSHRYNPSRLLTTYPFPGSIDGVRDPGNQLAAAMGQARDELGLGVTDLLNLVHAARSPAVEIKAIREAVAEVDRAVVAAHGFDLELAHDLQVTGSRTWFGLDATTTGLLRAHLLG